MDPFQIVRMGPLQGILVGSAPFAVVPKVSCYAASYAARDPNALPSGTPGASAARCRA
jgi:hypothetical protein